MRLINFLILGLVSCSGYDYADRVKNNTLSTDVNAKLSKFKQEQGIKENNSYTYYEQDAIDSSLPKFVLPD
jgi:hypothetical protein